MDKMKHQNSGDEMKKPSDPANQWDEPESPAPEGDSTSKKNPHNQDTFRSFSESEVNDSAPNSSRPKDSPMADDYNKLYPDMEETPKPILKDPLKNRVPKADTPVEESQDEESSSAPIYSPEKLKAIQEKAKQKGDSYKDIFGSVADIQTADSEMTGSLSALSAYEDGSRKSTMELVTGEAQADYVPTSTKPEISLEDVNKGSTAEEWRGEGKKRRWFFFNLPIWVHRTIVMIAIILIGSWAYFTKKEFVNLNGDNEVTNIVSYMWISTFMGAEQRALQGTRENEREYIMTRFRIGKFYDAVYQFRSQEKHLPNKLEEMEEKGYDVRVIQNDGWRLPFKIETFNNALIIRSAGEDSRYQTEDDITYTSELGLIIPVKDNKFLYP